MAVLACRPLAESARRSRPTRYWPDDVALLAEALLGGGRARIEWKAGNDRPSGQLWNLKRGEVKGIPDQAQPAGHQDDL
jgi:hypothetical protein